MLGAGPPLRAQGLAEWQLGAVGLITGQEFAAASLGYAVRPPGRMRFGGLIAVGASDAGAAGRAEVAVGYLANPIKRRGVAPYVAGGLAVAATKATRNAYLVVVLGIESRPAGSPGWFVEGGVGGGLRAAAGVRLRLRRGP